MNRFVCYHHRTTARGAEGVHIRGIMNALEGCGYGVKDLSIVSAFSVGDLNNKKNSVRNSFRSRLLHRFVDLLPEYFFKVAELLYNIRSFFVSFFVLLRMRSSVDFYYERYSYFNFGSLLACSFFNIPFFLEVNTTASKYDVRKIRFQAIAVKIEKFVLYRADKIFVVSGYLKKEIVGLYGIEPSKIVVTSNAVDPDIFEIDDNSNLLPAIYPVVDNFCEGKFVIGFVGVFVKWHGIDFLLDVFNTFVKEKDSSEDLVLLLVGDGPERENLKALIEKMKLNGRVMITGFVPHIHMKYFVNAFDLAVMPDSNEFGSPMKILEYMVMGKAVIAPSYGPICEIIANEVNGILFEPKNKFSFIEKITIMRENDVLRSKIGIDAKNVVKDRHTWTHNVELILHALGR